MPAKQPPFDHALGTLGTLLVERGLRYELYAVGGGALQLLGLIVRPTEDIDVVGLVERDRVVTARPLPSPLRAAITDVTKLLDQLLHALRDLGVPDASV